jgi:uncharacterized protein YcbK (DUF882 family)
MTKYTHPVGIGYFKYSEFLKDREIEYPLTEQQRINMVFLLDVISTIREKWGKPIQISSGYRPGRFNKAAGGAEKSAHLTCEAVDLVDHDGSLAKFCEPLLQQLDLYMENPKRTPGWVHLQTRKTKSGSRVFQP